MLPAGLAAHPVEPARAAAARSLLPSAQTVAVLTVGGCSCDLVRPRDPDPREDERHLRARFGRMRLPRDEIIRRLERHRRRPAGPAPGPWPQLLAAFVAEHARNAGPTLYILDFGDPPPSALPPAGTPSLTRTAAEVRARPDGWLEEGRPVLVVR
ncbi:MAG TPA: hypothetical protein VFZ26_00080 [Gemmatimonadales bacterium]